MDCAEGFLQQLVDPESALAREWDREHDEHVVRKLLAAVRGDFGSTTWAAFRLLAVDRLTAAQVAKELGMPENAVLLAKSRVMRRLRQEAGDLLR
jgi:RNA polymerase sigma-70 factor (ECF subfamily)